MSHLRQALTPVAAAAALFATLTHAQTPPAAGADKMLSTITINASADASAEGLTQPFAGGQVARGGRVGVLGTQDMMDTPFSTTSYTSELIKDQQAKSVADVLLNDPSVRIARGFGNFQETYYVRGFLLYSDDIAYNGLYGMLPRQYVSSEFFERVELLRGASTFLTGPAPGGTAIGGSINLLPKRAPNEPVSQVNFGIQSGGQTTISTDIARRFGPDQATGLRLNAVRRDGGTGVDNEKSEISALSVGLDWRSRDARLSADFGYQDYNLKEGRPNVTPAAGLTAIPAAPDADKNYAQPWTYSKEKDLFATFRGEFDINSQLTAWAAFGVREAKESNSLANPDLTNLQGATTSYRFDTASKESVTTVEAGLRAKLKTGNVGHTLIASVTDYVSKRKNAYGFSGPLASASSIYNPVASPQPANTAFGGQLDSPGLTYKIHSSSLALADTLSFADDSVLLTLGLRHQTIDQKNYAYGTGVLGDTNNDSRTSPVAAIVFKPTKEISLYANYIEALVKGDNAPAFSFTPFFAIANAGTALPTYVSKQKEIGVKYASGTFGASAALFSTKQPTAFADPVTQIYGRFGEQRNQGLELSVFGEPLKGVRTLGGLTLLDAKQLSSPLGATNGKDAIGVPRHQINLGAEWDIPGVRGLALNARVINTSKQYANAANTQELPSWTRVDIGARYLTDISGKLVTWRARIDNVANKNYWASAGGYPGAGYLVLGGPRTFVLSASVDF